MKRKFLTIALALTLVSVVVTGCGTTGHAKELTQNAGTGINVDESRPSMQPVQQFGYEILAQNLEEKNPVVSPVSAYIALCMLGQGAAGETKEELRNVLGGDMVSIPYHLVQTLPQEKEHTQFTIANSAWLDDMFEAEDEWLGKVKGLLDASVYQTDLGTAETLDDINRWVSDRTDKMIPTLLDEPMDNSTRLALLSALYFRADWEQAFDADNTREGEFHTEQGEEKQVQMMAQMFEECGYLKDDMAKGVVLPYADSNFAFIAVMPVHGESVRDWYASYSADMLDALIQNSGKQPVTVMLPKFNASCRKKLDTALKNMGVTLAFDESQADFSAIGRDKEGANLYVSLVLQEAVIHVAEKGTQAAAATAVIIEAGGAMPVPAQEIYFDRPFLYGIWDMASGVPVFMGILDDPTESCSN